MKKEELEALIAQGEGPSLEFKESWSDSIAKEISAFANTKGGRILVGVGDDKMIRKISMTNRVKSQIQDLARNMDPQVSRIH